MRGDRRSLATKMHHGLRVARNYYHDMRRWLDCEETDERERLAAALDSPDNRTAYGAQLELFLSMDFHRRGWTFQRHPVLPSMRTHPDYLVHSPHGDFIVEAAVIMDSDEERAEGRLHEELREALHSVTGPFQAIMTVMNPTLPGGFSRKQVVGFLRESVERLGGESRTRHHRFIYTE